jgi:divalent metal cation (Fe/Co/Zn/Cd) transporter
VAERFPEIKQVHGIEIQRVGESLHVVLKCHFEPNINMVKAYEISSLEREIKNVYPQIAKIDFHEEPA